MKLPTNIFNHWQPLSLALAASVAIAGCGSSGSDSSTTNSSSSVSSSSSTSSSSSSEQSSSSSVASELSRLHAAGTQWVKADGTPIALKGTNLGNWLLQEFWMMGQSTDAVNDQCTLEGVFDQRFGSAERERLMELFRDNWITERDWDQMAEFGLNVVRVPFMWNLIEDEANPYTLRSDAWEYLDRAISEAESRDMYVILDLHGAVGAQGWEHHSGCAEQNWYWDGGNGQDAAYYQDRTAWLWQQIAERYKTSDTVAGYGLLNEPWGTTPETLAENIESLYHKVREVDQEHIIILPGHSQGIDAYGNPADRGMENVAFEMHFYPGIFGWGEIGYQVHRDWLTCGANGTGGVCEWEARLNALDTPFLIGEFQPWTGLGGELGGKIARATYDTYAQYGWAATSWAYKVLSNTGGQGNGTWGMVTNQTSLGLLTKADTWACSGWDSAFNAACGTSTPTFTAPGEGAQDYYLVIKAGACCDAGSLDVSLDSISLQNSATDAELLSNGEFTDNSSWTPWTAGEAVNVEFNQTDQVPTNGNEGALRLTSATESNGGLYQKVSLTGGQHYQFAGVFKDNGSTDAWAEIYLVPTQPVDGEDITGNALAQLDFNTASLAEIEALFKAFGSLDYDVHTELKHWLTTEQTPELFTLKNPPNNVTLVETDNGNQLTWSASVEPGVEGYRIYRSNVAGSTGVRIAQVDNLEYLDLTAPEQTTFYQISSYSGDAESYPSASVATTTLATALPGTVQAEHFSAMSGVEIETTSDAGGGHNIGYVDTGDWLDYLVNVEAAGTYTIEYRLASAGGSDGFSLLLGDSTLDTVAVPDTGDWQSWQSVSHSITLPAGEHTLRVKALAGSWNFNWLRVSAP